MTKKKTATSTPKAPAQSAWARGPPKPSPSELLSSIRSLSSSPATPISSKTALHPRKAAKLNLGVNVKQGVSVPLSSVGSARKESAVAFGSVDDVFPPLSPSPGVPRVHEINGQSLKKFGSVLAMNSVLSGKASPKLNMSQEPVSSTATHFTPQPQFTIKHTPPSDQQLHHDHLHAPPGLLPPTKPKNATASSEQSPGADKKPANLSSATETKPIKQGLNSAATAFVPRSSKVAVRSLDGKVVNPEILKNFVNGNPGDLTGSPGKGYAAHVAREKSKKKPVEKVIDGGDILKMMEEKEQSGGKHISKEGRRDRTQLRDYNVLGMIQETAQLGVNEPPLYQVAETGYSHTPGVGVVQLLSETTNIEVGQPRQDPLEWGIKPALNINDVADPLGTSSNTARTRRTPIYATAQPIEDFDQIEYPEGIVSPKTINGILRYDRAFLLQFMCICREKPDIIPLEPLAKLFIKGSSPHPNLWACGHDEPSRYSDTYVGEVVSNEKSHPPGTNQQNHSLDVVILRRSPTISWSKAMRTIENHIEPFELATRKVRALLNKLTTGSFDSISDRVVRCLDDMEQEDGRGLNQIVTLILEQAVRKARQSKLFALLCQKLVDRIQLVVQDDVMGESFAGTLLFKRFLHVQCWEHFERRCYAHKIALTQEHGSNVIAITTMRKAKLQDQEFIEFMGELFNLHVLGERIVLDCGRKLLAGAGNGDEEVVEKLCKWLVIVGPALDTHAQLDAYFNKIEDIRWIPGLSLRVRYMLQDVVELRGRKWAARATTKGSTPGLRKVKPDHLSLRFVYTACQNEVKNRGDNLDGWVAGGGSEPPRPSPKSGDLSNIGKIKKATPATFGPSVFAGRKDTLKWESLSQTFSSNMFSISNQDSDITPETVVTASRPPGRKASVGFSQPDVPGDLRKKIDEDGWLLTDVRR